MTKFLKIIPIIEKASDMNRPTAKIVCSPTFNQTKLTVDLILRVLCIENIAIIHK